MTNFKTQTQIPQVGRNRYPQSHTGQPVCPKDSGGDKDSLNKERCHTNLYVATYNARSTASEGRMEELTYELNKIKWDVLGISETRKRGEGSIKLASGHTLFYKGKEDSSHGGVGIIVHRRLTPHIRHMKATSDRVIYITIKINKLVSVKIIQAYAPTNSYEDEEVQKFYEDVSKSINENKTYHVLVIGDFNCKVGKQTGRDETYIGRHGLGIRNTRGQMMVNFLEQEQLYNASTFFAKKDNRKWTWVSPDGKTKNQIDYILSKHKYIVQDVNVLNRFNTGSDHRLVRAAIKIDHKLERYKKMKKNTIHHIDYKQLKLNSQEYQMSMKNKFEAFQVEDKDIDVINDNIVNIIKDSAKKYIKPKSTKNDKLSQETKQMLEKRRLLIIEDKRNTVEYAEVNKTARKMAKSDILKYKTQLAQNILEQHKGMKIFRRQTGDRKEIVKLTNKNGDLVTDKSQILKVVEEFYEDLYKSKAENDTEDKERKRVVINVNSEEIPSISREEIERALKETKHGKAAGDDDIVVEMLKDGGEVIIEKLIKLFNLCLEKEDIPGAWANAIVVLIYKKGDKESLENYRPISLLSQMYKLFARIITNRLTKKLDFYQPKEQAGFRKDYSTVEHLQTMKTVIEKVTEYNIPLWVAFIDYKKAFDTVEIWAVLQALKNARIDSRYNKLIEQIYKKATLQIRLHENTEKISIKRGVRQGDNMSPKLFTLVLEDAYKRIEWGNRGISILGERLTHLRFADDVVLFAETKDQLISMLEDVHKASVRVGLELNFQKTKYMTNERDEQEEQDIEMGENQVQRVESYIYLGQTLTIGKGNQQIEIDRRIRQGWAAYGKLKDIFEMNIPLQLKRQLYNQCILPVVTYGAETWVLTKEIINKLRVHQRAIERKILGVTLRDHKTNTWIRARTGVEDVITRVASLKWNWAGHVARGTEKWSGKVIRWRPWTEKRNVGRPQMRWSDDIKRTAGLNWYREAQNREHWKSMREAYIQRVENG